MYCDLFLQIPYCVCAKIWLYIPILYCSLVIKKYISIWNATMAGYLQSMSKLFEAKCFDYFVVNIVCSHWQSWAAINPRNDVREKSQKTRVVNPRWTSLLCAEPSDLHDHYQYFPQGPIYKPKRSCTGISLCKIQLANHSTGQKEEVPYRGKVWWIAYQFVFGGIKFGELLNANSTGMWHFNTVRKETLAVGSLANSLSIFLWRNKIWQIIKSTFNWYVAL